MAPAFRPWLRQLSWLLWLLVPHARCLMRPETEALMHERGQLAQLQNTEKHEKHDEKHEEEQKPCTSYGPGLHLVQMPQVQRQFLLSVPDDLAPGDGGVPLVLGFHGFSDSPWYSNMMMGLSKKLTRYGWLGILPFGMDANRSNGMGGVEACCPDDCRGECCMQGKHLRKKDDTACGWRDNQKDLDFVRVLLKWAQLNTCADMNKAFAIGFSNGGMCGSADDEAFCQPTFLASAAHWSARLKCDGAGLEGAKVFNFSATTSCFTWESCEAKNFVEVCTTLGLGHDPSGHLRPDGSSYIRPGSDLDIVGYALQKFSLLVDGSILFFGHPTREEFAYKESVWPPPTHDDHMYIRNGSLNTV